MENIISKTEYEVTLNAIQKSLNTDSLSITCVVGICTSTVLITKVGMRGK